MIVTATFRMASEILFDGTSRKKFVNRTVTSFSVFKNDIRPEWEDPANSTGAEWFLRKRMSPFSRLYHNAFAYSSNNQ